jgi:hypothetical protein
MTSALAPATTPNDAKYFRALVTIMAVILVAGFVFNLAMGRSSFAAPTVIHVHAVVYMAWVGIVFSNFWLAGAGAIHWHRQLGLLAVAWSGALMVLGPWVTIAVVQIGRTPFFFQPQHFLFANILGLAAFFGLFAAAIALRKQTDWHARLQIGAFASLMGPGFGRLLPMPFLTPYAFEAASLAGLIFPIIGLVRDRRVHGRTHPAWMWTIGAIVLALVVARLVAFTSLGGDAYAFLTAGTPMEGTEGLAFPPPPPGM